MSIKYTEQEVVDKIKDFIRTEKIELLYKADFINYTGTISDTGEKYTELVSRKLIESSIIDMLKSIKPIERHNTYNMPRDEAKNSEDINISEKKVAREMWEQQYIEGIGEILNYQIPLKGTMADKGVGEIDLISFNSESKTLRLLELKRDTSETMLRCVLEIYTYSKQVFEEKLKKDFGIPESTQMLPVPLIKKGSSQDSELGNDSESKHLKELMRLLGIEQVFLWEKVDGKYIAEAKEV